MSKSNVIDLSGREESRDPLTEMLRAGAQQLIQQAVEAELQELLAQHAQKPVRPVLCATATCHSVIYRPVWARCRLRFPRCDPEPVNR